MANKKMIYAALGAVAGGAGGYAAGTMVDKTDYAAKDPNAAYKAKLAGAGALLVAGVAGLALKQPVIGAVALGLGLGSGAEAYTAHEAYKTSTAPPSVSVAPGGGSPPIVLSAPQLGGLPVTLSTTGVSPAPGALPTEKVLFTGQSPPILALPQSAGAMRIQSGAAVRLGMSQSGAAVRLGM